MERKNIYIGGFGLSIPAVTCVMSHLVFHVLTEAHFVFGQSHFDQIQVDSSNEVAQHRVVDDSLQQRDSEYKDVRQILN